MQIYEQSQDLKMTEYVIQIMALATEVITLSSTFKNETQLRPRNISFQK